MRKKVVLNCGEDQLDDEMFYMKWGTCTKRRINENMKKPITIRLMAKNKICCNVEKALTSFKREFKNILAHESRILHQKMTLKN